MHLARAGAAHGTVVIADAQSDGRGRHGRTWYSPPGTNLYCSIIIREVGQGLALPEWLSWVPLVSALAVAKAVQVVTAVPLTLKWPNDLLLHERKVGGILCESALTSTSDLTVVIGIGLNVNVPGTAFPEELRLIATSLLEASRRPIDRNHLIAQLLLNLEEHLNELRSQGTTRLRQAYTSSCSTLGRPVRVLFDGEKELSGTAVSIGTDGALQVRSSDPSEKDSPALIEVRAADVIHLRE